MKKIIVLSVLLLLLLPITSYGLENDYIDIGLKFGSQIDEVDLVFDKGMSFGFNSTNNYNELLSFKGVSNITLYKDTTYSLQVKKSYKSIDEMSNDLEAIRKKGIEVYPVFDNGLYIRIGKYKSSSEAKSDINKLKSKVNGSLEVKEPSKTFVKIYSGKNTLFVYNTVDGRSLYLKSLGDYFQYSGKKYRNGLKIARYENSDLTIINRLRMDEYLYGVLPREMSSSWPIEALKAQAVTARSFAIKSRGKHSSMGFDLCTTTDCQVYGGYDSEGPISNRAVDETSGKLLYFGNDIANTYYHSNSGGYTANIKNIWGAEYPYLVSVEDSFSIGSPHSDWKIELSKDQMENTLSKNDINIGKIKDISVIDKSIDGRVTKLLFQGSKGSKVLERELPRKVIGYTKLKSMNFDVYKNSSVIVKNQAKTLTTSLKDKYIISSDSKKSKTKQNQIYVVFSGKEAKEISYSDADFTIHGHGFGHGIGMSQYGAKKMAELGYTYDQILYHYYKGTAVR